ncbi:MAG: YihY/virulence factor BrkB family protein [Acidimicrobiales bacterium]
MARLKALPDRWPWLAVLIAVQRRFGEINGGFIAAALTLALFLSLFPLVLVALAVLGFLSAGNDTLAADIVDNLGLSEGTAKDMILEAIETAQDNRKSSSVVGLLGLLWAGLGVVGALQNAINTAWQVKGRGLRDRLYGLAWLAGAGLLLAASFTLAGFLTVLPGPVTPVAFMAGSLTHVLLFWWTFHVLGSPGVGWRPLLPGALAGGIGFQVLTVVGAVYVPKAVADSSALYGSIGIVFAILAWLFFFGRLVVYASVLNVVLFERDRGTVTAEIRVPRLPDVVPLETTRGGAVGQVATIDQPVSQ